MTEADRPTVFLDASALYPSLLRNILMRLAPRNLFRALWSARVQEEWTNAVLRNRPDLPRAQIERTRRLMEENIDDATVEGYEHLIETVTLPDPDDRHVLAAAIYGGASTIVTANLRDFPAAALAPFEIEALHPDAFMEKLLAARPMEVVAALRELREDMRKPPISVAELLAAMSRQGLSASAETLAGFENSL